MAAWSWAEPMPAVELLLLRHGIAQERSLAAAQGLPERERPLTAKGRQRTAAVVERLVDLQLDCDWILSSPLPRALQTAEIALAGGLAPRMLLADELAPEADPLALLASWLGPSAPEPGWKRLCLVGHEPDLSLLAGRLCGAPAGFLRLRKAGVAVLELPAACERSGAPLTGACLIQLLTPLSLSGALRRP
ncbi:histidine phosphatase family protein [Synechococcus sp. CS-1325]|uniref:SixA phosphatase family protein n=1 Tax=Synechococcus sp. CS-1325 TaxID=2847979 RepID=UPI00223AB893|nr:histidine phosphatase family protein [Synechococcus sp. CS-1325]